MHDEKMCIAVITHKDVKRYVMNGYEYLFVGAYDKDKASIGDGYFFDDEGDSISKLNKYYAEITGLYWMWKNTDYDIYGLVHYRRFFSTRRIVKSHRFFLSDNQIENLLKKYDYIIPLKYYVQGNSNKANYEMYHNNDLLRMRAVIEEWFPDYLDDYDEVLKQNYLYPFNMFICKCDKLDDYCKWLFDVINKSGFDLSEYDGKQSRVYGFMSERLFNVWIKHGKFKCKEVPVIQTDSSLSYRIKQIIQSIIKKNISTQHIR